MEKNNHKMKFLIAFFAIFTCFLMVSNAVGSPMNQVKSKIVINKYKEYFQELESFSKTVLEDEELMKLYDENDISGFEARLKSDYREELLMIEELREKIIDNDDAENLLNALVVESKDTGKNRAFPMVSGIFDFIRNKISNRFQNIFDFMGKTQSRISSSSSESYTISVEGYGEIDEKCGLIFGGLALILAIIGTIVHIITEILPGDNPILSRIYGIMFSIAGSLASLK